MGEAHTTTSAGFCNVYNLPMADDGKAKISVYVCSDVSLYWQMSFGAKEDNNHRHSPRNINGFTDDGDYLLV